MRAVSCCALSSANALAFHQPQPKDDRANGQEKSALTEDDMRCTAVFYPGFGIDESFCIDFNEANEDEVMNWLYDLGGDHMPSMCVRFFFW